MDAKAIQRITGLSRAAVYNHKLHEMTLTELNDWLEKAKVDYRQKGSHLIDLAAGFGILQSDIKELLRATGSNHG